MTWHRVLLLAENIIMQKEDGPALMGLYVTRYIQADGAAAAAAGAVDTLWQELRQPDAGFGLDHPGASIRADEVEAIAPDAVQAQPQGYVFFAIDPVPPFLLLNPSRPAVWAERRAIADWTATRSFVTDGNFLGAELYDASGRCWPVLEARLSALPTGLARLLPWHQHGLSIRLGPERPVAFEAVRSTLGHFWALAAEQDDRPALPSAKLAAAKGVEDLVALVLGQDR